MSSCAFISSYALFLISSTLGSLISYEVTDLGLGGVSSAAWAINNHGDVAGDVTYSGSITHPFFYSNGSAQDLGTLGKSPAVGRGLNESGQVVGWSYRTDGTVRATLITNGVTQDLGSLAGPSGSSFGAAVNDNGDAVGWTFRTTSGRHAFLYTNGTMYDLGTLPDQNVSTPTVDMESQASSINNDGDIVGWSRYSSNTTAQHAILISSGVMHDLGTLGGRSSSALDINDNGGIVGSSDVGLYFHAFFYENGAMQDLGTLPGRQTSIAVAINNFGQIIGNSYLNAFSGGSPFIYQSGTMYDLNDLINPLSGWVLNSAMDINDAGQIVGVGMISGQSRAFLLTPVPEVHSAFAICASFMIIAALRLRCARCV